MNVQNDANVFIILVIDGKYFISNYCLRGK